MRFLKIRNSYINIRFIESINSESICFDSNKNEKINESKSTTSILMNSSKIHQGLHFTKEKLLEALDKLIKIKSESILYCEFSEDGENFTIYNSNRVKVGSSDDKFITPVCRSL